MIKAETRYGMRILIVEDEKNLREALLALLEKSGYMADAVEDGISGLDHGLSGLYDAILLDIMLPRLNGLEVLKSLRAQRIAVPVLLLTARSEIEDKIHGLDMGADDYLTKPFDAGELLARLRALLRRKGELIEPEGASYGDLLLKSDSRTLFCGERSVKLGQKEYQLMEILLAYKGHIVQKDVLAEKVWGIEDSSEYNNVEVYVSFLRKKLGYLRSQTKITSTRGAGYALEKPEGQG